MENLTVLNIGLSGIMEKNVQSICNPMLSLMKKNTPVRIKGIIQDITDRKKKLKKPDEP